LKNAYIQEWHSLTEKPIPKHTTTADKPFKLRTVKRKEHFLFNLLCFLYFRRSAVQSIETSPVAIFIAAPYVFFAEAYFFRSPRYFVTMDRRIVGLVAFQERTDAIFISVLASRPFYRRMGVASFILEHAAKTARKLGKTSLELAVLKMNKPALKLYNDFGFHLKEEKRRSYVLQYHL
jgi:ribosomal protein S18 acetylase RimI-like enzyme